MGVEFLRVNIKYEGASCVPQVRTRGGLAMLWNDGVHVQLNTYSRNHIDVNIEEKSTGKEFRLTGFYGNAETHKRKESWVVLKHLSHLSHSPWVCMGDFNEVLDNSERLGRGYCSDLANQEF
jgi:endonuclease/exonuclease/phosphatase family metal-dependent hydrolase